MKINLFLLILLAPFIAFGQIIQIGGDIDGEAVGDRSGRSVSLSRDGSIVAIADLNSWNANSGRVRIYETTGEIWTQIGQDLSGEAADDESGRSVSLNADGSIVAIGALYHDGINGEDSGNVRVFQNIMGTWSQIGNNIEGEVALDRFGQAVSLSEDGSILAIGAPGHNAGNPYSGQVKVFQLIADTWTQIGQDLEGFEAFDAFGSSVSLTPDGYTLAIGAPFHGGKGQVKIFEYNSVNWIQIGQDIDGEYEDDLMGYWNDSLSLNVDGSIIAIGAYANDGNGVDSGHVRIYQYTGNDWEQLGEDIDGEGANDRSGCSVGLSNDGSIVAIGAYKNDGNTYESGHVRVFKYVEGNWMQVGQDIDGEAAYDESGYALSLNADGSIVAIGAPKNNGINGPFSGHVRVFDLSSVLEINANSLSDFSVYPNPTTGILHIESEMTIAQIGIYNLLGQLILSNESKNSIDLSGVGQGVYFVIVMDENGNISTQKVIKR